MPGSSWLQTCCSWAVQRGLRVVSSQKASLSLKSSGNSLKVFYELAGAFTVGRVVLC